VAVLTTALTSLIVFLVAEGHDRPWTARRPPVKPAPGHELISPGRWPAEPVSPVVDPVLFGDAFAYLCGRSVDEVPSEVLLASARSAGVDPFLLAALVRERSRCNTRRSVRQGYGLLDIQPAMYLQPGTPLPVDKADLTPAALLPVAHNLKVGAQLLRMWLDAHPMLDATFGGVPHRSGVAHFLWGDQVGSSAGEDAVFTARRRMIARYLRLPEPTQATPLGVPMVSPLEGAPRLASSGPGDDRDGGLRRHRGLDIAASEGEPVRSIASGKVIFAGANLRDAPRTGPIPPDRIGRYRNRLLGAGGIYVCIQHDLPAGSSAGPVVSCYMHLQDYDISCGERVRAGETIGRVGRTGVHNSPPHLHLEVRVDDEAKNPLRYLSDLVIPPSATRTYRHVLAVKRARAGAARAAAPGRTGT
jgi:hypothetical protein